MIDDTIRNFSSNYRHYSQVQNVLCICGCLCIDYQAQGDTESREMDMSDYEEDDDMSHASGSSFK